MWEGGGSIDAYGSSLALMMLPYFTHGHTSSMEGLYYESSAEPRRTTSWPRRRSKVPATRRTRCAGWTTATSADFDLGVEYLRMLGVNYYLAYSTDARAKADANAGLERVATVPDRDGKPPLGWAICKVAGAPLVQPLANEPVVATGIHSGTQSDCFRTPAPKGAPGEDAPRDPSLTPWECLSAAWWNTPGALDRPLAADGPASWARVPADRAGEAKRTQLPAVEVSKTHSTDDSVSFDVSRTGVPVLVKVSDYPNWAVRGAEGPYRVTPNFMVVVPTGRSTSSCTTPGPRPSGPGSPEPSGLGLVGLAGLVLLGRPARVAPALEPDPTDQAPSARPATVPALR